MKNYKKIIYAVAALISAATILFSNSCTKPDKVVGSFVIKGYLYDSCGGAPMNNVPLQVSFRSDRQMATKAVEDDEIGKGLTDANGYFEITCKKYNINGSSDLFISTSRFVLSNFPVGYMTKSIDMGNGYFKGILIKGKVKTSLSGVFKASDTFFIGNPSTEHQYFTDLYDGKEIEYSIVFKHNYSFYSGFKNTADDVGKLVSIRYPPYDTHYGFGKAHFKSDWQSNIIRYTATTCDMPDTTTSVTITK